MTPILTSVTNKTSFKITVCKNFYILKHIYINHILGAQVQETEVLIFLIDLNKCIHNITSNKKLPIKIFLYFFNIFYLTKIIRGPNAGCIYSK